MSIADNENKGDINMSSMTSSDESSGMENCSSNKRPRNDNRDGGGRTEERKAANRRSAHQSRIRKIMLFDDLQRKVKKLKKELILLKEENRVLLNNLETSLTENRQLLFAITRRKNWCARDRSCIDGLPWVLSEGV